MTIIFDPETVTVNSTAVEGNQINYITVAENSNLKVNLRNNVDRLVKLEGKALLLARDLTEEDVGEFDVEVEAEGEKATLTVTVVDPNAVEPIVNGIGNN